MRRTLQDDLVVAGDVDADGVRGVLSAGRPRASGRHTGSRARRVRGGGGDLKAIWRLTLGLSLVACSAACGSDAAGPGGEDNGGCAGPLCDTAGLQALGAPDFYAKLVWASGMPVMSSARVSDAALLVAREIVEHMLSSRSDVLQAMLERGSRVGIMARTEVTTDIPEHAYLANDPNTNWDTRARGLGGSLANPITTGAEENLLCLTADVYRGENILVHEFAHGMANLGIPFVDPDFRETLQSTYDAAVADGLWADTYARTNAGEYWAEGVQSWFDTNQRAQPGIHNGVDTRAELESYDPRLAALVGSWLPDDAWRPLCPS